MLSFFTKWSTDSKDALTIPLRDASLYSRRQQQPYPKQHVYTVPPQYLNSATKSIWDTVDRGDEWFQPKEGLVTNWLPAKFGSPKYLFSSVKKQNKKPVAPKMQHPQPVRYKEIFVYAPYALDTKLSHSTNTVQF